MTATTTTAQVQNPAPAQEPASLNDLFQQAAALFASVKSREGAGNWLADEVDDESASLPCADFECEIDDGPVMRVSQDGEHLHFDIYGLDEEGNEVPVALGVHQVMHLRDLLNEFLALPVNASAVKELEGAL